MSDSILLDHNFIMPSHYNTSSHTFSSIINNRPVSPQLYVVLRKFVSHVCSQHFTLGLQTRFVILTINHAISTGSGARATRANA